MHNEVKKRQNGQMWNICPFCLFFTSLCSDLRYTGLSFCPLFDAQRLWYAITIHVREDQEYTIWPPRHNPQNQNQHQVPLCQTGNVSCRRCCTCRPMSIFYSSLPSVRIFSL